MNKTNYTTFTDAIKKAKQTLIEVIKQYVLENGDAMSEYDENEFGLDENYYQYKVLAVLNIFDNGGCYYPIINRICEDELQDDNSWTHNAFQCLYVVEEDGEQRLMYYNLENSGILFDSEESEPDHNYAECLSLQDLHYLISFIERYDKILTKQKKNRRKTT